MRSPPMYHGSLYRLLHLFWKRFRRNQVVNIVTPSHPHVARRMPMWEGRETSGANVARVVIRRETCTSIRKYRFRQQSAQKCVFYFGVE
jgi:hypothetical protein